LMAARTLARQPAAGTAERELDTRWQVKTDGVDPALAEAILAKKSIGLTFYEAYETGLGNDAEFVGASADFAKTYGTLGMRTSEKSAASLAPGVAIAVKNRDDVEQAITSVHQTVHQLVERRRDADREAGVERVVEEPMIQTVAIFAHGIRKGLGLDPQGEAGSRWFGSGQIPKFVGAIRGHVAGNVRILLFACSTGGSEKEAPGIPAPGEAGGEGSFAAELAKELGGEATVYAHNIAGHAESNPRARVFTADSATGRQMFDVLYGDAFLSAEAERLSAGQPELAEKDRATALRTALRTLMWDHYVDAVSTDFNRINTKNRHFAVGGYGGVGAAMFMDPDGTAKVLRADFTTVWLTPARVATLTGKK